MSNNSYKVEYAKTGRSTCKLKQCKQLINVNEMRVGKCYPSPFHDGNQVDWYHGECAFKAMSSMKLTSVVAETEEQLEGLDSVSEEDRAKLVELIHALHAEREARKGGAKKPSTPKAKAKVVSAASSSSAAPAAVAKPQPAAQKALLHGFVEKKPLIPASAPKPAPATSLSPAEDPYKLADILDEPWLSVLLPVINNMDDVASRLAATATDIVPSRPKIFESFRGLDPKSVKVVAIGPGPTPTAQAACGYALLDARALNWTDKLPIRMQRIFDALKAHATNEGQPELSSSSAFSSMSPRQWFEYTKAQGVLWLNSCLVRNTESSFTSGDEARERAFWLPIVVRVLRYLMEVSATSSSNRGLVFALFGAQGSPRYDDINAAISKYFSRFSATLSVRKFLAVDPSETAFETDEDNNPFAQINAMLMETNNPVINWLPPKKATATAVPPKPAKATQSARSIMDDEADDDIPPRPTIQKKRTVAEMSHNAPEHHDVDWESALAPKPKKQKTTINDDEDDDWKPSSLRAAEPKAAGKKKQKKSLIDSGEEEEDEYDSNDSFIAPEGEVEAEEEDDDPRPICKYGQACYRKNPDHFKQFRHPWKDGK